MDGFAQVFESVDYPRHRPYPGKNP